MGVTYTPSTIVSGYNMSVIQTQFDNIATALEDALSRSGATAGGTNVMTADIDMNGNNILNVLATYADNAAAIAGGLATGTMYKTATGEVRIVI